MSIVILQGNFFSKVSHCVCELNIQFAMPGSHICVICVVAFSTCTELKRHWVEHLVGAINDCSQCCNQKQEAKIPMPAVVVEPDRHKIVELEKDEEDEIVLVDDIKVEEIDVEEYIRESEATVEENRKDPRLGSKIGKKPSNKFPEKSEATLNESPKTDQLVEEALEDSGNEETNAEVGFDIDEEERMQDIDDTLIAEALASPAKDTPRRPKAGMLRCPDKYPDCAYQTPIPARMRDHIRVRHERVKDKLCPEAGCEYASGRKGDLNKHVKEVHRRSGGGGAQNWTCSGCREKFVTRSHLMIHKKKMPSCLRHPKRRQKNN